MPEFIDAKELSSFSIVELLYRLGHLPAYKSGKEFFYHSMLRETSKKTPSLTVWDEGGKWRDWGGAGITDISGGGIIQLGMALWPERDFVGVLAKINEIMGTGAAQYSRNEFLSTVPVKTRSSDFGFTLVQTRPIGSNQILSQYLQERGIFDTADNYLSEVYYRNTSVTEGRPLFAVGWKNNSDGWEFANAKGFKSSIGPKDLSLINGSDGHFAVFEGMMDFLSWKKLNTKEELPNIIILNSIAMVGRAIAQLSGAEKIDLYLDRDHSGEKCTQQIMASYPIAEDRSSEYVGYKDYNEKLVDMERTATRGDPVFPASTIHRSR